MQTAQITPPLTNVQYELLKLFDREIPEDDLLELKNIMARFLFEKARTKSDRIAERREYNTQTFNRLLNEE